MYLVCSFHCESIDPWMSCGICQTSSNNACQTTRDRIPDTCQPPPSPSATFRVFVLIDMSDRSAHYPTVLRCAPGLHGVFDSHMLLWECIWYVFFTAIPLSNPFISQMFCGVRRVVSTLMTWPCIDAQACSERADRRHTSTTAYVLSLCILQT